MPVSIAQKCACGPATVGCIGGAWPAPPPPPPAPHIRSCPQGNNDNVLQRPEIGDRLSVRKLCSWASDRPRGLGAAPQQWPDGGSAALERRIANSPCTTHGTCRLRGLGLLRTSQGLTLLVVQVRQAIPVAFQMLLEHCDPAKETPNEVTAVHMAAEEGHVDILNLLVQKAVCQCPPPRRTCAALSVGCVGLGWVRQGDANSWHCNATPFFFPPVK